FLRKSNEYAINTLYHKCTVFVSFNYTSLLNPITGSGSLAPYKYQFLGDGTITYNLDSQLLEKIVCYAIYCLILYLLAVLILRKKGN
ncbi:hypothetical protein ACJBZI_07935, partial [Streptococcus suis]